MVFESGSGWPSDRLGLQREEPTEVKTVHVDGISVWCGRIGIGQDGHEEPSRAYDHGDAEVRARLEVEEHSAASIDIYKLVIGLV